MIRGILSIGILFLLVAQGVSVYRFAEAEEEQDLPVASEANNLRNLIEEKNAELQKIQEEREKIEKSIEETAQSKNSLTKELKTIDYNINQLNLSIKANKLTLEKLELEINSLSTNILSTEKSVDAKKTWPKVWQRHNQSPPLIVSLKKE